MQVYEEVKKTVKKLKKKLFSWKVQELPSFISFFYY